MFGKNEIVGQKFFKDADGLYYVTSMFLTLQGEGPFAGLGFNVFWGAAVGLGVA